MEKVSRKMVSLTANVPMAYKIIWVKDDNNDNCSGKH